jgi:TolB-like protein/Flp pilus assembly protein TadD
MAGEIFISYRRADQAWAQLLHSQLRAEGVEAWYDAQVGAGQDWRIATAKALESSQIFVLLFSENAAQSSDIAKELAAATLEKKLIIPVRLQNIAPKGAFLYELASRNWVNAYEDTETKLAELAKGLAHLVRTGARDESVLPFDRADGGHTPAQTRKRTYASALIAAAAVLVIAVFGIAAWLLWRSLQPAAPGRDQATSHATASKPESDTAAFSPPSHSVAVLPFVNMSGDPKQDYFSDGVSEELLNALSRLNDLQVVARTSSFSFKGQNVDVATIAHKLNVGAVLEGSVRRAGNTVRITAQLINTVTGFHLWSETYDRPFNDIFKVQTEVATAVAQQLEIKLAGNSTKFAVGGTRNTDAFDAYLRAQRLYEEGPGGTAGWRAVLAMLDEAIALDPNYADAYTRRAEALLGLAHISNADEAKALHEQAAVAAERAVTLAPDSGDAHAALGSVRFEVYLDFVGGAAEFDQALALAPGSAIVQRNAAWYMAALGHFEPALKAAQRAVDLDPQNWFTYINQGETFYYARHYGEALAAFQHALPLKPGSTLLNSDLGFTFFMLGQTEQARQLCEAATAPIVKDTQHRCLALVYHALGRQADAGHELDQYKKLDADGHLVGYAEIYAQWGNAADALRWLSNAERLHDNYGLMQLKTDPLLDPIRNEPQFKALLARMKFPP